MVVRMGRWTWMRRVRRWSSSGRGWRGWGREGGHELMWWALVCRLISCWHVAWVREYLPL
jgi:hypothetical protein